MSKPNPEHRFLESTFQGNRDAVLFVLMLGEISQAVDDLYDRDEEIWPDDVARIFWQCLVSLPCNPFYQQHFQILQPQLQMVFFDWLNANELEQGGEHERNLSFVLRDNLVGLVVTCARLIGGYEYAKTVGPGIRRYFHDEELLAYKEELQ